MVLVQKLKFFSLFIFGKIDQENVFDDILERKKLLHTIKQQVKKVEKLGFFQTDFFFGFGPKIGIFPSFFFEEKARIMCFTIKGQNNVFHDILERKILV